MRKFWSSIFLMMLVAVLLTACTNKNAKETKIEITEAEEQKELQEEDVNTDIGFPGEVLEESDSDDEIAEETLDSNSQIVEENVDETVDNSESVIPEKKGDDGPIKENTYDGDLLEPPAVGSDGVL